MFNNLEFSELLITKFCHDIAGQISAIDNGLDFIKEGESEIKDKAMELVSSASSELMARINFFRYAYGNVKHDGEADIEQLSALIQNLFKHSKIQVNWYQNTDICLKGITNRACKLLINLVIIAASSLIYGGEIEIRIEKGRMGKLLKIIGKGKDIKLHPFIKSILINHEQKELNLSTIQLHLTNEIANALGTVLNLEHQHDYIVYYAEFQK